MMSPRLTRDRVTDAFRRMAECLNDGPEIDILVVGGIAGMLAGYLPMARVTEDCDVMFWSPGDSWDELALLADSAGRQCGLPTGWFNNGAQVFEHRLLPDWETRRLTLFAAGRLHIAAPGRVDYMAMKTLASRDTDIDDVLAMTPTRVECTTIRRAFESWPSDHFASETIPEALELLAAIEQAIDGADLTEDIHEATR